MNSEEEKAVGTDLYFNKSSCEWQETNSAVAQGGNRVFKYRIFFVHLDVEGGETLEREQT